MLISRCIVTFSCESRNSQYLSFIAMGKIKFLKRPFYDLYGLAIKP